MSSQLNITVGEAFEMFLLAKRAENVQRGTIRNYKWTQSYWQERVGNSFALSEVTPDIVRHFMLWLQGETQENFPAPKMKGATARIHFRNLRAFFNWCAAEEILSRTPMRNVKPPIVEDVIPDALEEDEVVTILDKVKNNEDRNSFRDYVILLCLLATGIRLEEISNLDLDDVNWAKGTIKVMGKGRRERIVPMGALLAKELRKYVLQYRHANEGETALLVNEYGQRLLARGIQSMVIRDLKKYVSRKLNRTGPHTLRHTFGFLRDRHGENIRETQVIMGHSNVTTTERYSRYNMMKLINGDTPSERESLSPVDRLIKPRQRNRKRDSLPPTSE